MLTTSIIIFAVALILLCFTLISAALRLRSTREQALICLVIYLSSAVAVYLLDVAPALQLLLLPDVTITQFGTLALLVLILSFGLLSLSFLRAPKKAITLSWPAAGLVLLLWSLVTFRVWTLPGLDHNQIAQIIAGVGWVAALGAALVMLWKSFQAQPSARHLNRLRYWIIITTLHGASGLILLAAPPQSNIYGLYLLLPGTLLTGYTVLNYHTPDLYRLIGSSLQYFSTTAIIATVFFVGLVATVIFSRSAVAPINVFFWSTVLAITLAVVIPPLLALIKRLSSRIILGRGYRDDKEIIRHYSRSISSALDTQRLGDILVKLMKETLDIQQAIVFVNERGDSSLTSLRPLAKVGTGTTEPTSIKLESKSLFVNHFRAGKKHLYQYDIDVLPAFSELDEEERLWLTGMKMELYIPIIRSHNLMGLLAIGPRPQGAPYLPEDVELMIALADQAVLAMDSARLFEQLASITQEADLLNAQLDGLDQNKTDFLSIASHELRTPLTHIHGYSRMLLDLTDEETKDVNYVKTIVEGIAKGSERLKKIIDTMFDVTEANVGEMNLLLGPVDLEEIIKQATGPFLPALDERRIAFDKQGFADLPILEADGARLKQALENLISNAIKYTPDGGLVTVTTKVVVMDHIGSAVEIVVADTGIGIDPENHKRIFEKFFRVDDTDHHSTGRTKFKGAGPGLGLTLVKGIIEAHGGSVWVESRAHNEERCPGSKFFIIIPLHPTGLVKKKGQKQSQIETVNWSSKEIKNRAGNPEK